MLASARANPVSDVSSRPSSARTSRSSWASGAARGVSLRIHRKPPETGFDEPNMHAWESESVHLESRCIPSTRRSRETRNEKERACQMRVGNATAVAAAHSNVNTYMLRHHDEVHVFLSRRRPQDVVGSWSDCIPCRTRQDRTVRSVVHHRRFLSHRITTMGE